MEQAQNLPAEVQNLMKKEDPLTVTVDTAKKDAGWTADLKDVNLRIQNNALAKLTGKPGVMVWNKGEQLKILPKDPKDEPRLVSLPEGEYDKQKLIAVVTELKGKKLSDEKIIELCVKMAKPGADQTFTRLGYLCATTPETVGIDNAPARMSRGVVEISVDANGKFQFTQPAPFNAPFRPISGTIFKPMEDGTLAPTYINSAEMYRQLLPYLVSAYNSAFYPTAVCTERVAYLADKADEVMAEIRTQFEKLPEVEVYAITPVWLRYYTDAGGRTGQRSKRWGIRRIKRGVSGFQEVDTDAGLVYDGPSYMVGVKILGKAIPGRLFVAPNLDFICSEWCQREVDKEVGVDLMTGDLTKHTLLTWCAVPGLHKFGGTAKGMLASAKHNAEQLQQARQKAVFARLLAQLETGDKLRLWEVKPDPADPKRSQAYYRTTWNPQALARGHFLEVDRIKFLTRMLFFKSGKYYILGVSFRRMDMAGLEVVQLVYEQKADGQWRLVDTYRGGSHEASAWFGNSDKAIIVPQPLDAMVWDSITHVLKNHFGYRLDLLITPYVVNDAPPPEAIDYTAGLCLDAAPLPKEVVEAEGVAVDGEDEGDGEHAEDEEEQEEE